METTAAEVIIRELTARVGAAVPIRVVHRFGEPHVYDIWIGDGGPNSLSIAWQEGMIFTPEIVDGWEREYRLLQAYGTGYEPLPPAAIPLARDVNFEVNAIHDAVGREMLNDLAGLAPAPTFPTRHWIRTPDVPANAIIGGIMAANATNVTINGIYRTPEQEIRYHVLEGEVQVRVFTDGERMEYYNLQAMHPCPTPVIPPLRGPVMPPPQVTHHPRVRVRVWRDDYQQWQATVKVDATVRELPTIAVIKSLLPPGDKKYLPARQGRHRGTLGILRNALAAGLPAQSLHDALRAWVVAMEGAVTNVQSDEPLLDESTAALLNAQPATLEVGGKVYRLVPTKELDARPLIKRVRDKAISLARVESAAIKGRAQTDARVVVSEAEARASTLRAEIERERATLGNRAPEWVVNSRRAHYWDGVYWNVEMRVLCQVKEIRYTVQDWNRVLYWLPVNQHETSYYALTHNRLPMWVRLRHDGLYTKEDISCKGFVCTHIDDSYMCMELQGLPTALRGREDLNNLEAAIGRGMRVVNLNSPLNTTIGRYWPVFKEQLPPVPIGLMTSGNRASNYITPNGRTIEVWKAAYPTITWEREEFIHQEAATIFHVQEGTNATPR